MIDPLDDELHALLLGRPVREPLDGDDRAAFAGQRALITGAGGSIGSVLALELARCHPARLVLLEQSEYHLFWLERLLREAFPSVPVDAVLGDVTRPEDVEAAVAAARPHVVYHAAAYKHVTMCEQAVCASIRANVLGTRVAAGAAAAHGARFVLVSTDKAAQASSVMGATKRLAELVALATGPATSRAIVVRFGNVLGSRGSLLELVADRIRDARPVEVTDAEATRYFMTPREAASLLMKADLIGEAGAIYWLDMGAPVRVLDVVERAIRWSVERGATPAPIRYIGLRPGEKLREELTTQGLSLAPTSEPGIWCARQPPFDPHLVHRFVMALLDDVRRCDSASALLDLQAAVPEFVPDAQTVEQSFIAAAERSRERRGGRDAQVA